MHPKVLSAQAWDLVAELVKGSVLEGWTLCGGTGLALHFGHRVSEDLDFFHFDEFEVDDLLSDLTMLGQVQVTGRARRTIHVFVNEVRLSFLGLEAPLINKSVRYRGLTVGDPRDIAILKIIAIGGRGSRKDFIDLYCYLQQAPGLSVLLDQLESRDSSIDWNRYHLMKSLTWFEEADREPMPDMLVDIDWDDVKEFFENQVIKLL